MDFKIENVDVHIDINGHKCNMRISKNGGISFIVDGLLSRLSLFKLRKVEDSVEELNDAEGTDYSDKHLKKIWLALANCELAVSKIATFVNDFNHE